ncbi:DNA helicase MCM8 [Chionoecetes opilio]|uniref:DNA helicase MCM8 n=1 Tax=Chionoecetes opilio TaxID=41210 RepID=A0A8J4YTX0_CHIOP|nr:DNA helicase MCM8 [Chionoecetes opilio]
MFVTFLQALMEAMEQQTVSIAKAGVLCTLPARTSIMAAANPWGGHYNRAKTVSENLRLKPAMLSRFDLIFVLLDKPDEELDCRLSEHVMALHSGPGSKMGHTNTSKGSRNTSFTSASLTHDDDKPLSEYLKQPACEPFDPLPPQLLRKYICYARRYVNPRLSPAAAKVLQEFYLDLRQNHISEAIPITTRQLESLVRLTQVAHSLVHHFSPLPLHLVEMISILFCASVICQ